LVEALGLQFFLRRGANVRVIASRYLIRCHRQAGSSMPAAPVRARIGAGLAGPRGVEGRHGRGTLCRCCPGRASHHRRLGAARTARPTFTPESKHRFQLRRKPYCLSDSTRMSTSSIALPCEINYEWSPDLGKLGSTPVHPSPSGTETGGFPLHHGCPCRSTRVHGRGVWVAARDCRSDSAIPLVGLPFQSHADSP
jgi:hypothetical protein